MIFSFIPTLSKGEEEKKTLSLALSKGQSGIPLVRQRGLFFFFMLIGFLIFFKLETFAQISDSLNESRISTVPLSVTITMIPREVTHSSIQDFPDAIIPTNFYLINKSLKKKVSLTLEPVLQLQGGLDVATKNKTLDLVGGFKTRIRTKQLVLDVKAAKGFTELAGYQKEYVQDHEVIPGMAYARSYKNGYFYNYVAANFWYKPSKHFYIQLGYDKNFIGDGYRSLLLSDNASNYPFLKLSTTVWKFKYINLWAQFNDIRNSAGDKDLFQKKYGAFHYLDWEVNKRLNIGFFETIIWQNSDSVGYRGFDVNYLNPFIFYRPVEFSIGSPDNALMGMNVKLRLWKNTFLYSQIMLDEFYLVHIRERDGWWANKQGVQLGFKVYDLFRIKNLYIQSEANYVRPFTYSHYAVIKNYGHYNQPLAHPLGSNFLESVNFITYSYKKFYIEYEAMAAMKGENIDSLNYGGDLYESYLTFANEYGNYTGQGLKTYIFYNSLKLSYLLNATNKMGFFIQFIDRRKYTPIADQHSLFVMAGIQLCPLKKYWDF